VARRRGPGVDRQPRKSHVMLKLGIDALVFLRPSARRLVELTSASMDSLLTYGAAAEPAKGMEEDSRTSPGARRGRRLPTAGLERLKYVTCVL
jgi:hypothetical protein